MFKNRVTYGAVVLFLGWFVVLHDYPTTYGALYAALILPLISGLLAWWQKSRLEVSAQFPSRLVDKGAEAGLEVEIHNPTFFSCGFGKITLKSERFGLIINPIEQYFSIPGNAVGKTTFEMVGKYRGTYDVETFVEFRDMLGLFRFKLKSPSPCQLTIAPRLIPVKPVLLEAAAQDTATTRKQISGDDLSHFDQLREFQLTDSYRHIHWKASAKRGKFISKEFTDSDTLAAVLFMDNAYGGTSKGAVLMEDRMMDHAISLTQRLLYQGFRVGWQSTGSEPLEFRHDFVRLYEMAAHLPFNGTTALGKVLQDYARKRREPVTIMVYAQSVNDELLLALYELKSAGNPLTLYLAGGGQSRRLRELDIPIVDLEKGGGDHVAA